MKRVAGPGRVIDGKVVHDHLPVSVVPMEPIFYRDGFYLERCNGSRSCWFECNGKAWTYEVDMFKLPFENIYSEREIDVLKEIVKTRFASKEQRELLGKILSDWHTRVGNLNIRRITLRTLRIAAERAKLRESDLKPGNIYHSPSSLQKLLINSIARSRGT